MLQGFSVLRENDSGHRIERDQHAPSFDLRGQDADLLSDEFAPCLPVLRENPGPFFEATSVKVVELDDKFSRQFRAVDGMTVEDLNRSDLIP